MKNAGLLAAIVCMMAAVNFAPADIIRDINIDFVTIGNVGNAADTGGTVGCGAVDYNYRIGKYEVTNAQWDTLIIAAGAPTGNPNSAYGYHAALTDAQQPAPDISWYAATQFCNYLTSGDKSLGAYQFSGNNTNPGDFIGIDRAAAMATYGTIYVLPTEDEWYKAAYYKPDGSGYSVYANGLDTIPAPDNGWHYGFPFDVNVTPWDVGTGAQEQNGTFDMMGNVAEWNETLITYGRGVRGGTHRTSATALASYGQDGMPPDHRGYVMGYGTMGFRVAEVPEPATILLFTLGGLVLKKLSG